MAIACIHDYTCIHVDCGVHRQSSVHPMLRSTLYPIALLKLAELIETLKTTVHAGTYQRMQLNLQIGLVVNAEIVEPQARAHWLWLVAC